MKILNAFLVIILFLCGCSTMSVSNKHNTLAEKVVGSDHESIGIPSQAAASTDNTISSIQEILKPWHPFEDRWVTNATIIFAGIYGWSTYPCIEEDDGTSYMPERSYFILDRVLKGEINKDEIDFNSAMMNEGNSPQLFVIKRQYLVFMKPNHENMKLLKDRGSDFTAFQNIESEEIIAMIDLSQSKVEAESFSITSNKCGTFKGFEFTPEKWMSLRNSEISDVKEQNTFLPFIRNKVLIRGASLAHVRSYLGDPDDQHMFEEGHLYTTYDLNSHVMGHKGNVKIYCCLDIHFSGELKLIDYSINYFKTSKEDETSITTPLTQEEMLNLGLSRVEDFRP
jgi:hypothetical protein